VCALCRLQAKMRSWTEEGLVLSWAEGLVLSWVEEGLVLSSAVGKELPDERIGHVHTNVQTPTTQFSFRLMLVAKVVGPKFCK
jgi:hypothetical protein